MKTLITLFAALLLATVTFAGKPAPTNRADDRTFSVSNFDKLALYPINRADMDDEDRIATFIVKLPRDTGRADGQQFRVRM